MRTWLAEFKAATLSVTLAIAIIILCSSRVSTQPDYLAPIPAPAGSPCENTAPDCDDICNAHSGAASACNLDTPIGNCLRTNCKSTCYLCEHTPAAPLASATPAEVPSPSQTSHLPLAYASDTLSRSVLSPSPCSFSCVDIPAPSSPYTCAEQKSFGNCNSTFISTPVPGLPQGYCQVTCGKCYGAPAPCSLEAVGPITSASIPSTTPFQPSASATAVTSTAISAIAPPSISPVQVAGPPISTTTTSTPSSSTTTVPAATAHSVAASHPSPFSQMLAPSATPAGPSPPALSPTPPAITPLFSSAATPAVTPAVSPATTPAGIYVKTSAATPVATPLVTPDAAHRTTPAAEPTTTPATTPTASPLKVPSTSPTSKPDAVETPSSTPVSAATPAGSPVTASGIVAPVSGSLAAFCVDIPPPDSAYTCAEQRDFGQCDASFMTETNPGAPSGYCQITCGRCDIAVPAVSSAPATASLFSSSPVTIVALSPIASSSPGGLSSPAATPSVLASPGATPQAPSAVPFPAAAAATNSLVASQASPHASPQPVALSPAPKSTATASLTPQTPVNQASSIPATSESLPPVPPEASPPYAASNTPAITLPGAVSSSPASTLSAAGPTPAVFTSKSVMPVSAPSTPGHCVDLQSDCTDICQQLENDCTAPGGIGDYVRANCKKTCKLCPSPPPSAVSSLPSPLQYLSVKSSPAPSHSPASPKVFYPLPSVPSDIDNGAVGRPRSSPQSAGEANCTAYTWNTGQWSACNATCGFASQNRSVDCLGYDPALSPKAAAEAAFCDAGAKPISVVPCITSPCAADYSAACGMAPAATSPISGRRLLWW